MNNWKVIPTIVFSTVLIFGAGVFTGGILVDDVKQSRPRSALKPHLPPVSLTNAIFPTSSTNTITTTARPPRPPEILSKDFLQRLDADLHLNKDEHEAIQKIISDGQNQIRKVVQDARLEIREVLTADQRDQFDELMKRPFHKPLFNTNAPLINPASTNVNSTNAR